MKRRSILTLCLFGMIILLLVPACQLPVLGGDEEGTLSLSIADAINARTLVPEASMVASSYRLDGTGPGGASFSETSLGGAVTLRHLAFGRWTVMVRALNAELTLIGQGQAEADVHTGRTTEMAVTVRPLAGTGSLELILSWDAAQVESPSVEAFLVPTQGDALPLVFNVDGSEASYSGQGIPAGYQTLTVQLLDNGLPVMGAMEVVRIAAGLPTCGSFHFGNVNQPGGRIIVNITPEMADPISLSIAGLPASLAFGAALSASVSVDDGTPNTVSEWYLNGVSVAMGQNLSLRYLPVGYYRLDVRTYSADGLRAGSASQEFQVKPWLEDFESYEAGAYPSGGWYNLWSGQSAGVVKGSGHSGNLGFRLDGFPNWVRADGIDLALSGLDSLVYEAAVMVPEGSATGGMIGFFLRTKPNESTAFNSVWLAGGREITACGSETQGTGITCEYGRWYLITVRLDYLAGSMDVWIDGQKAVTGLPARDKTASQTFFLGTLWSMSAGGSACFDDISFRQ